MLVGLIEPKIRHRPAQARSKSYAQLVAHGPLALRPFPDAEHPSAQQQREKERKREVGRLMKLCRLAPHTGFLMRNTRQPDNGETARND